MPRIIEEEGHAHFLTIKCNLNIPHFRNSYLCKLFLDQLIITRNRLNFKLLAYVIMPNHIHLLIFNDSKVRVSRILHSIKRPFSYKAMKYIEMNNARIASRLKVTRKGKQYYQFWQEGAFGRNVYSDEVVRKTIEYMHNNPVRANLVTEPVEWRWSSARLWEENNPDPGIIDFPPWTD